MALKFNILLIYLFVVSVGGRASTEVSGTYALPKSAKEIIPQGYCDVKVGVLQNNKFLFLSSDGDVNKCSILFKIDGDKFNEDPVIGLDGKFLQRNSNGGFSNKFLAR